MTPATRLSLQEAAQRLTAFGAWTLAEDGLSMRRCYRFADFAHAFAFMTQVALAAEKANHHPEWSNVYNQVDMRLCTHDVGGLTEKDMALAALADAAARGLGGA